jgi:hypothetical protein
MALLPDDTTAPYKKLVGFRKWEDDSVPSLDDPRVRLQVRSFFAKRQVMKDLTSARLIKAKGILFLLLGLLSASLLFFGYPTPKTGVLLVIAIWSFCRFYYFAFYVIEHYVDRSYRFSGLLSFALYLIQKKRPNTRTDR